MRSSGPTRPGWLRGRNLYLSGGGAAVVLLALWMFTRGDGRRGTLSHGAGRSRRDHARRERDGHAAAAGLGERRLDRVGAGAERGSRLQQPGARRPGAGAPRSDDVPSAHRASASAIWRRRRRRRRSRNADYQRYQLLAAARLRLRAIDEPAARGARHARARRWQQAAAAVATARTDLERSVIRSPIDGVVVDRQVSVGQSVAASFQAATLFIIAQDLSRLQANITVDEADIGDVARRPARALHGRCVSRSRVRRPRQPGAPAGRRLSRAW